MYQGSHGPHICASTTYPTTCQSCRQDVFYFSCSHGSRVFFDDLGEDWPVHDCGRRRRYSGTLTDREPDPDRYRSVVVVSLEEVYEGTTTEAVFFIRGERRAVRVSLPPGVDNGSTIRTAAEWAPELTVIVGVKSHQRFRRRKSDLYMDIELPRDKEVCDVFQVQTIDGQLLSVTVPKSTRKGGTLHLKGYGMPTRGSPRTRGDLYVILKRRGRFGWLRNLLHR